MSAVIHLDAYRAERARDEYIRALADELEAVSDTHEGRLYMAGYYEGQGWANADDIQAALALLGVEGE